jgi:hypothetical protein
MVKALLIFMIVVHCILLSLLILASSTTIPSPNTSAGAALDLQDPTKVPQIITPCLGPVDTDFEYIFEKGQVLRRKLAMSGTKAIVTKLEEIIGEIINQSHTISVFENHSASIRGNRISLAGTFLHGFFDNVNNSPFLSMNKYDMIKAALKKNASNLLLVLQYSDYWDSVEQSLWFLIKVYISGHFSKEAMEKDQRHLDWYLMHDFPKLFPRELLKVALEKQALLKISHLLSRVSLNVSHPLGRDSLKEPHPLGRDFDLFIIFKFDLYESFESTSPEIVQDAIKHVRILAESGSFKLLRFLAESQSIDLHLEDYLFPNKLPKNMDEFKFFWAQGYCYVYYSDIVTEACRCGRVDILAFFYTQNSNFELNYDHVDLAASNGHLNILEWALNHDSYVSLERAGKALIINGHFEILKKVGKRLEFPHYEAWHHLSGIAAENNQLDTIQWLHVNFNVVPDSGLLGNASIMMLEWIELVSPLSINHELACSANLEVLKWLLEKHPHLLTFDVKRVHGHKLLTVEKVQWMLSQGWEITPDFGLDCDIKTLRFLYNAVGIEPTCNCARSAAENGRIKVLKLIHGIKPSCIDKDTLLKAVEHGHLEAAKYLELVLNLKGKLLEFNLEEAFSIGNLELIEWIYQYYGPYQPKDTWLKRATRHGHLHVINWALMKNFISEKDEKYLDDAVQCNQYLVFQRLIDYGVIITDTGYFIRRHSFIKSLKIAKYLAEKDPDNAHYMTDKWYSIHASHIRQWFSDQNSCFKSFISVVGWLSYLIQRWNNTSM